MPASPRNPWRVGLLSASEFEKLGLTGRVGIVELATELGIARNTVQARLRRLEDAGVMTEFLPTVDLAQAGVTT